jgi:MFS family permease
MPTVAGDLDGFRALPWIGTAYLLTATLSMPVAGRVSDALGTRRVLLISLALLGLGSALGAVAPTMISVIVARGIQGLGAGGIGTAAFVAIAEVAGPHRRGRYQSYLGALFGVASVVGPPLGGLITDALSWRWIFWLNVGAAVLILLVTGWVLPQTSRTMDDTRMDYPGIVLVGLLVTGLVLLSSVSVTSYALPALTAATVAALIAVVVVERRSDHPLLPPIVLRRAGVAGASVVGFLAAMALFGLLTYLPVFLQLVNGHDPARAGTLLIPFMATVVAASMTVGRIVDRTRRPWPFIAGGTAVAALAMALFAGMDVETPQLVTALFGVLFGLGIGMVMQLIVLAGQGDAPDGMIGTATSTVLFVREIGSLLGVTALGGVMNARLAPALARVPGGAERVDDLTPQTLGSLPPDDRLAIASVFRQALSAVFTASTMLLVLASFVALVVRLRLKRGAERLAP